MHTRRHSRPVIEVILHLDSGRLPGVKTILIFEISVMVFLPSSQGYHEGYNEGNLERRTTKMLHTFFVVSYCPFFFIGRS